MPPIPSHDTPVVDSSWDGPAAEAALPNDAGASVFRREYAWIDPNADPDTKAAYKFPHHDVTDGKPGAANMAACRAGMSRIPQANIPSGDDAGVQAHLQNHMDAMMSRSAPSEPLGDLLAVALEETQIEVRDEAKREIDVRLVPWDTPIDTITGREMFARGAFDGTEPKDVILSEPEHELHFAIGQNGQPTLKRHPAGKAISLRNGEDGQYATFKVARTRAGDEILALAADGISRGVSIEFREVPGGSASEIVGGRRTRVHRHARLSGATPTYQPAYPRAEILAVRSQQEETPVPPETVEAPVTQSTPAPAFDPAPILNRITGMETLIAERFAKLEEHARSQFTVPVAQNEDKPVPLGDWASAAIRILTGERVPELARTVADVINTDNAGVLPTQYLTEVMGVIDASRPFLSTTRRLATPGAGQDFKVPRITQRPTAGVQSTEKTELSSRKTTIDSVTFDAVSIGGVGDISLQLLKRSSPSFLELYIQLLGEAYAIESEEQAITALFNAIGGVGAGNALNPNNLSLGDAFVASFDAIRRPPDTIWLSTQAVGEFIDAKATTSNQPLYPGLRASATAAGGIEGVISGLRPVHVPTLDAHGCYAIVGPSSGFAWAEDGTYTLQVDVPSKAGRDVALVGILWPAPWYPDAFTAWNVASGS